VETVETCNLCGSKQQKVIEHYKLYGQEFAFVECLDCGLAFLNPRPMLTGMAAYYGEEYAKAHYHKFQEPTFPWTLFPQVQRVWLKARYGGRIVSTLACWLVLPLEISWRWTVRCNILYGLTSIGRVLDVGCGNGSWLGRMKLYGFECYGCEVDPVRAQIAASIKGVKISATDLHGARYADNYFDVVHIWNVLEHVHDPMAVLYETNRVLKRGGLVVISSPNHNSILARVYPNWEDVPRHLFSFSPKTIGLYLEKTGFRLNHLQTRGDPWAIYGRFYEASLSYLREHGLGKEEEMAERFWKSRMRKFEYRPTRGFFSKIGAGHALFAAGVKV
jgi:2-polyprenyl-3-methyl-5-hydroxy-6-metoxy-1,4-benzoquinol methylase